MAGCAQMLRRLLNLIKWHLVSITPWKTYFDIMAGLRRVFTATQRACSFLELPCTHIAYTKTTSTMITDGPKQLTHHGRGHTATAVVAYSRNAHNCQTTRMHTHTHGRKRDLFTVHKLTLQNSKLSKFNSFDFFSLCSFWIDHLVVVVVGVVVECESNTLTQRWHSDVSATSYNDDDGQQRPSSNVDMSRIDFWCGYARAVSSFFKFTRYFVVITGHTILASRCIWQQQHQGERERENDGGQRTEAEWRKGSDILKIMRMNNTNVCPVRVFVVCVWAISYWSAATGVKWTMNRIE